MTTHYYRRLTFTLLLVTLAGGACGLQGHPIQPGPDGGNTGGGGASSSSSSGSTGGGGPTKCGNGKVDPGEDCDGADLAGITCASFGGEAGTLACTPACTFDPSGCKMPERCNDGVDNDGNGLTDCLDPTCAGACADACSADAIVAMLDPNQQNGYSPGHGTTPGASCASSTGGGPEVVYEIVANHTGVLAASLTTIADLGLSVRTTCGDASTEKGCFDHYRGPGTVQRLSVPSVQGETYFIVVSGHAHSDAGAYTLSAGSRPIVCGDGFTDGAETCDDGNTIAGDGCSASCKLESSEVEPNDTSSQANAYHTSWYASVASASDVDVVKVNVSSAPASITASLHDLDGHSCDDGTLEAHLDVLAPDGSTVLAVDDTGGKDVCASTIAAASMPGTYYVRVAPSQVAAVPTFPYRLDVVVAAVPCGDSVIGAGEQCDDGNLVNGDGCSSTCQLEPTEAEPNEMPVQANAYHAGWVGKIAPAGDVDMISFTVPAGATKITARIDDNGDGDCNAYKIVSSLEILAADGSTVLGQNEGTVLNYCAVLTVAPDQAGKHYVRIKAGAPAQQATFTYTLKIDVQ